MARPDRTLIRIVLLLLLLHLVNVQLEVNRGEAGRRLHGPLGVACALALVALHGHARRRASAPAKPPAGGPLELFHPAGVATLFFAWSGFSAPPPLRAAPSGDPGARALAARVALAGLSALFLAFAVAAAVAALLHGAGASPAITGAAQAARDLALRLFLLQLLPMPPLDGALLLAALIPALDRPFARFAAHGPWLLFLLAVFGPLTALLDRMAEIAPAMPDAPVDPMTEGHA